MQSALIYTIGHSNQDMAAFLKLLKDNAIQVVVDVRSAPYSRYVPQFNKQEMETAVTQAGLKYVFMGDAIGGKPADPNYLDVNGKVMYYKVAASEMFQQGLARLSKGLEDGWVIALVCAEEDPLKCHRHLLIANELEMKRNIPVWHIRSNYTRIRAKEYFEYNDSEQLKLF
jgi:uncharacterized protein (DUF488 family)